MLFTDIIGFVKGGVVIEAEGGFLERFLNICMRRGIYLSDVNRTSEQKLRAKIGIKGFKEIRPIAKKTRTRVRIKKRTGLPFLLHRYRSRRFAIAGILLFFVILYYLSTHIMGIDIVGNQRISTAELERELKNFGLYRGAAVSSLDSKLIQNKMMTQFDDLAWIGVSVKGARAYIEVKERLDTKISVDTDVPCNIVASRDGVIRSMEVRSGQSVVGVNEAVAKGDLLVSGAVDSGVFGIRWEHSSGNIYAETIYKKSGEYPLNFTEKEYTGKTKAQHSIVIFGKEIKLSLKKAPPFEYSDKKSETFSYNLISNKLPPLVIKRDTFKEYIPQKRTRDEAEAAALGKKELFSELERELSGRAEIQNKQATYKLISPDKVEVTAEFICREDIARQIVLERLDAEE